MPSFDIVSEIDWAEVDNALNQARKELSQRFDFKGSDTKVEKSDKELIIESADDYKVQAAFDVVKSKFAKRQIDLACFDAGKVEPASGGRSRQTIKLQEGIDKDKSKEIGKYIKGTNSKLQTSIQGEALRVTGKNRDDLQGAISAVKEKGFGLPLQFTNFRD